MADWLPSIVLLVLLIAAVLLATVIIPPPIGSLNPDRIDLGLKILAAVVATGGAILAGSRSLVFGSNFAAQSYMQLRTDPFSPIMKLFQRLVTAIRRPLAVFIDDLDRCEGTYVIALLEGIQTLFRTAPVAYVVAADRKWICSSFEQKYGDFKKTIGEPGRPLGYLFLDKVFQVSASVPRLSDKMRQAYWDGLLVTGVSRGSGEAEVARRQAEDEAIDVVKNDHTYEQLNARIQAAQDPVAEQALRAAAAKQITSPAAARVTEHRLKRFADLVEANPRSMKRLVNAYGLHQAAHFLEGRSVAPEALIRWTILELRWPLLAEYLATSPETLRPVTDANSVNAQLPKEIAALLTDEGVRRVLGVDTTPEATALDEQTVRQIVGTTSPRPPAL